MPASFSSNLSPSVRPTLPSSHHPTLPLLFSLSPLQKRFFSRGLSHLQQLDPLMCQLMDSLQVEQADLLASVAEGDCDPEEVRTTVR